MNNKKYETANYGQYCRGQRKLKKISVRKMSEATDIHPGAIIKFELGKTDMTMSRFFRIIGYLGISLVDLDTWVKIHYGKK